LEILTFSFETTTEGYADIIDITVNIQQMITKNLFREGNVLVFVPGATAGITTIEHEPGLLKDYPKFWERLIPSTVSYNHDETWHDGNGFSHLRAALQGASLTVPFKKGKLLLGTWQQIILVDFDNRQRNRKVIVQVIGEKDETYGD